MADVNLINLPEKTTPAETDIVIIEDAVATKRMTWANFVKPIKDMIGNLASLTTTHKSSVVGAINELQANNSLPLPIINKYSDGLMRIRGVFNVSDTVNQAWGGSGLAYRTVVLTFPQTFFTNPEYINLTVIAIGHDYGVISSVFNVNQLSASVMLIRPSDTTARAYRIAYEAIGRWK